MSTNDTTCFTGQDGQISCHTCNDIVEEYDKKNWRFNTDGWQNDSLKKGLIPLCKQVFTNLSRPAGISCRESSHCASGNCENNVCKNNGASNQQPNVPRQQPQLQPQLQPRQQMPLPYPSPPQITRPEMPQAPSTPPITQGHSPTPSYGDQSKSQNSNGPTTTPPTNDNQGNTSLWAFSWSKLTSCVLCILVILVAVAMYARWRKNNYY